MAFLPAMNLSLAFLGVPLSELMLLMIMGNLIVNLRYIWLSRESSFETLQPPATSILPRKPDHQQCKCSAKNTRIIVCRWWAYASSLIKLSTLQPLPELSSHVYSWHLDQGTKFQQPAAGIRATVHHRQSPLQACNRPSAVQCRTTQVGGRVVDVSKVGARDTNDISTE